MKTFNWREWLIIIICIGLPIAYLSSIYGSLPDIVPTHFNHKGEVDGRGEKSTLLVMTIFISGISLFTYFLVKYANKIDPKKSGQSPELLQKIAYMLLVFLSAIQMVIIHSTQTGSLEGNKYLMPLIGLLFAGLGNFMHSIKPNYFIGMRLPWTLEDPENWRKTHQVGSKLWMIGGIAIAVITPFFNGAPGFTIAMVILAIIVIYPMMYSYRFYKKQQHEK